MLLNPKSVAALQALNDLGFATKSYEKLHCQKRHFEGTFGSSDKYVTVLVEKKDYVPIAKVTETGSSMTKDEYNQLVKAGVLDHQLIVAAVKDGELVIRSLDPKSDETIKVASYVFDVPSKAAAELDSVLSEKSAPASTQLDSVAEAPKEAAAGDEEQPFM